MTAKEEYIILSKNNNDIPVFMQPWWLDTVTKKNWDVFLYKKKDNIIAAMPYYIVKKLFFKILYPPAFTPHLGIYIDYSHVKTRHQQYNLENEICEYFISEIKKLKLSAFFYPLNTDNGFSSPFFRSGFACNVRYTYITDITDINNCYNNFTSMIKRNITKSSAIVTVDDREGNLEEIYNILSQTYKNQNKKIPYSYDLLQNISYRATRKGCGRWFIARDGQKNIHACVFTVWDNTTAYAVISGKNEQFRKSNANCLAHYHAMIHANSRNLKYYDFEGSMLRGIEAFFMNFDTVRIPYIYISKYFCHPYGAIHKLRHGQ